MHLLHVLLVGIALACARTVPYTLNIENRYVAPDGFNRSAVTVNGVTPGPVLTANKGDRFVVRVNNHLTDHAMRITTTVHWHGISQPRLAYDDGPEFITQCPISPNNSYTYHLDTGDQAGTFWYHSHLGSQYIDGLRGPLIIYDHEGDPHRMLYDVDDIDTIITFTDWFHSPAPYLISQWMSSQIPEPAPDSNLFNGIGRYKGGPQVPRAVVNVVQGKRYRLRLINMSAYATFNFSVEAHPITIIEADGISYHPHTVGYLPIGGGQRYSIILNANNNVANYWMTYHSEFRDITSPGVNPHFNGTEAYAILRYVGAPIAEPQTAYLRPNESDPLREYRLTPLRSPPAPMDSPIVFNLTFRPPDAGGTVDTPGNTRVWVVNNVSFTLPTIPILTRILANENISAYPNHGIYVLPRNRTVDVRLIGDEHHPFHLHGHSFQVIQSAEGPRNEVNPPIRDTVISNNASDTATPGPVTIRFNTNNPGPWLLHCHKTWHMEAGLALVFIESPEDQRIGSNSIQPTPEWLRLCSIYNSLPQRYKTPHIPLSGIRPCRETPCREVDTDRPQQEFITHHASHGGRT